MSKNINRFVIHEHHARRLHWDFRLEATELPNHGRMVLKSWAVPKGPPTKEGEKRLAVAVPDHEIEYIDFEGEITEGEYGAGKVTIWDSGTYTLEKRNLEEYKFTLSGKKLQGSFALFHPNSFKEGQFLFIKHKE
ncbi:3'-phosphoesterase [Candidatus Gottesmanbacteria bacterium]|nr:3'-phosphoesterase [Candidatus Gottesmanbacteria bacterium]